MTYESPFPPEAHTSKFYTLQSKDTYLHINHAIKEIIYI